MAWSSRAVRGLVLACHPGPTVVVTGLAATLAAGIGAAPATTLLLAAAVLAGQLSVGWSNDWLDAARDVAVARPGKPVVVGLLDGRTLRTAAFTAVAVCVPLSLATGWLPGAVHLVAAWWAIVGASLLGFGALAANVLPVLEDDIATGVSGLPHRRGRARTTLMALGALVAAVALLVLAPAGHPSAAAWAGGGAAVVLAGVGAVASRTNPRSRLPFTAAMAVAVVCVVVLVLAGPAIER